jgi:hypothetical protein
MKLLADIPHPSCKITLYGWNGKYILKLEQNQFEQTYKVSELDVAGEDDIRDLLSDTFLEKVLRRFQEMKADWELAMEDLED